MSVSKDHTCSIFSVYIQYVTCRVTVNASVQRTCLSSRVPQPVGLSGTNGLDGDHITYDQSVLLILKYTFMILAHKSGKTINVSVLILKPDVYLAQIIFTIKTWFTILILPIGVRSMFWDPMNLLLMQTEPPSLDTFNWTK